MGRPVGEPVSADPDLPRRSPRRSLTPFSWFGVAAGVAAAWAVYQTLAWTTVPGLDNLDWPTVGGILLALTAFFVLGIRSPAND